MDVHAIQRVTAAIKARLNVAIGEEEDSPLVYVGALHDTGADDAYLVLFLYRIVPNAELRNTRHMVRAADPQDPPLVYENALPLDLHFVLTAGGRQRNDADSERDGLLRLGQAMRALNDQPLFGGADLDDELVRVTLYPASNDEMSRVWTLFPDQNYRTSVLYLASPVWIDPARPFQAAQPTVAAPHRVGPAALTEAA